LFQTKLPWNSVLLESHPEPNDPSCDRDLTLVVAWHLPVEAWLGIGYDTAILDSYRPFCYYRDRG